MEYSTEYQLKRQAEIDAIGNGIKSRYPSDPHKRYLAAAQVVNKRAGIGSLNDVRVLAVACSLESQIGGQWHLGEIFNRRLPCPPPPEPPVAKVLPIKRQPPAPVAAPVVPIDIDDDDAPHPDGYINPRRPGELLTAKATGTSSVTACSGADKPPQTEECRRPVESEPTVHDDNKVMIDMSNIYKIPQAINDFPEPEKPRRQPPPRLYPRMPRPRMALLKHGSDPEIAGVLVEHLMEAFGDVVYTEGKFWRYAETHWVDIKKDDMNVAVQAYDGWYFGKEGENEKLTPIKLNDNRIRSILLCAAARISVDGFFDCKDIGINCASGFIKFDASGAPSLEHHSPAHRARHTLPGRWREGTDGTPPAGSLLNKLLSGVFKGEDDAEAKKNVVGEITGSAALGYGAHDRGARAFIYLGPTANNGKTQVAFLTRGVLPDDAVSAIPADKMSDEKFIVGLVGKLLNASDEMSPAKAIGGEMFKAVVTGEPIMGRGNYKDPITFRNQSQQLFTANTLPAFAGGIDRGIRTRVAVLLFNREFSLSERIDRIGERIAEEEPDFLLAFAVAGASRRIANRGFTIPKSSALALEEWITSSDPVLAWLDTAVEWTSPFNADDSKTRTNKAYANFCEWAVWAGYDAKLLPKLNGFTQRVVASAGRHRKKAAKGNVPVFVGITFLSDWEALKREEEAVRYAAAFGAQG